MWKKLSRMKSCYEGMNCGFAEISDREIGIGRPRNFSRRFSASQIIVEQLNLENKLNGHDGCVNAVEFNSTGDLLVSGSDDSKVILWDWARNSMRFSYPSGHLDNIFQTKIMPLSDDQKIVTSAADGKVRLGQLLDDGRVVTKMLGEHQGSVHELAVEPGSPHILYSCGEDGLVQHFDLRNTSTTKLFYCTSFTERSKQPPKSVELNAIVINPSNPNYFALGGSDEYARLYDMRSCRGDALVKSDRVLDTFCPHHLIQTNNFHITGLAFSNSSELLITYSDELIYLFQKNMGLGPSPLTASSENLLMKLEQPQVFSGHRNSATVKGVNFFGPNAEYVMSGSDCGHIYIWKKKEAVIVKSMVGDRNVVNHIEPHPHLPILATCGIENDVKIWTPIACDVPPLPDDIEQIMESNRQGREDHSLVTLTPDVIMHVLRLQRRQASAFTERRRTTADIDSDEENEWEAYNLEVVNGNASSEEDPAEVSSECNIS
ncbi:DDB1- and CUL4-associated factor 8 [Momordica charantia]|uniref:DDB1- and CUL4-associated factor 8 n=1 Tax=Momordica charantia TaxID=3673 RepID=A0A6J1CXN7_MOMCH|nr:DDB1- and CUL4-associated factor 8 [Momordica charantia]XP_022146099.1 DDB1- and CUL4-associated factor 8 [Momordica charantia]